jgi:hypothetical protein
MCALMAATVWVRKHVRENEQDDQQQQHARSNERSECGEDGGMVERTTFGVKNLDSMLSKHLLSQSSVTRPP